MKITTGLKLELFLFWETSLEPFRPLGARLSDSINQETYVISCFKGAISNSRLHY
jgi:hypothetical protein